MPKGQGQLTAPDYCFHLANLLMLLPPPLCAFCT